MPTLTLLDEAMLRAGRMVPAVNRLGGGAIAMAGSQQPWRVVGSEAVVYQLRQQNGRVIALRCLLSDTPDPALADRYRALSNDATLRRLRAGGDSPIVGQITYMADGLTLPGTELRSITQPVIGMDWVMGPTLLAAADRACRARDAHYLLALAQAWRSAMESLHAVQFVHGNLSGDNAMVRPREGIALVDYDTAYWPGAPLLKQIDARPGYRHPKGIPADPDRRDDFAALVIYASLRLLAAWPELREEHGDPASRLGGTLLFSAQDLANPDGSALFGKVRVLDDPEVQALVASLREACRQKPDGGTPFIEVARAAATAVRQIAPPTPILRPLPHFDSAREREQKLSRLHGFLAAGDEDGAFHYWRTSGLIDDPEAIREMGRRIDEIERRRTRPERRPAPAHTDRDRTLEKWSATPEWEAAPLESDRPIEPPKRRSEAIERLARALEDGDAGLVGQLWPDVRHDPSASPYAARANEVIAKLLGAAVAGAIERGDDAAIVRVVRDAEVQGFAIGMVARRAARAAAARLSAQRRLDAALAIDDRAALSGMALTGELDEMGEFDEATTRQVMRALATPHLERAVANGDDNAIYQAFEAEVFGGIDGVPPEIAERVTLAVSRVRWLRSVRSALRNRDVTSLRRAMDAIPEQADARLSRSEQARIKRLLRRDDALAKLEAAIAKRDDNAIVDALDEVEAAGATLPPDLNWDAIRGVIDRLSLIASIRRIANAPRVDYSRLARLLAQAREEMGGGTPYLGAQLDFEQLEQEVWRAARRSRIREALRSHDDKTIVAAALPDLYGAISTLEPKERERVQRAIANHRGNVPPARPLTASPTS
ncbi:MAG: hypothetical protein IT336_05385 [Thermomicrobiales bacterium]|nr:hypothetical protein [Thermomicrobiales bacterium]